MNNKLTSVAALLLCALSVQLSTCSAQDTLIAYQGRVLDNGTNFTGLGQFKFAIVTSTNTSRTAVATANITGGFVTSYNVTFGGGGYTSPPAVTVVGGGGSGATATANVSGGAITSIVASNAGSGYTNPPTVVIAPPPPNVSYTTFWSNDGTSLNGSEPAAAVGVSVSNGLFRVVLGDTAQPNMTAISAALFIQPQLQLRIWFNDGVNGSVALNPVQDLTATPYTAFANSASRLVSGLTVQPNTNGAPNVIGGSEINFVSANVVGATIGGGGATNYLGTRYTNSVTASFGTVSGGLSNSVSSFAATIGGGFQNTASAQGTTVSGGYRNTANESLATVCGGERNTARIYATVCGGYSNTASGAASIVAGGSQNVASGFYSFAAGYKAQSVHDYSFVWSDGYGFSSTGTGQFAVRANGGARFDANVSLEGGYRRLELSGGNSLGFLYGSYPYFGDGVHMGYNFYADGNGSPHVVNAGGGSSRITAGYSEVVLAVGNVGFGPNLVRLNATLAGVTVNGTFNNNSDRNAKENFEPVSASQVLEKVTRLPISKWSYKEDATTRHIGPMAQDFHRAFHIGTDEKHIAPMDEGGVALAAIQGLNQKLEAQRAENAELKHEVLELKKLVQRLIEER
jgi:hypothetical protein